MQAESIRTSQRLEIGILSVSAHESCVCWVITLTRVDFADELLHVSLHV